MGRAKETVHPEDLRILVRNRWIPLIDYTGEGDDFLARRATSIFGNKSYDYSLLRLRNKDGAKKFDAFIEIDRDKARKLQGSIRTGKCAAEKIYFSFKSDETIEVTVRHPLAEAESKLLLLGWECATGETSKPWPKRIEFSKKAAPLLARGLSLMGYELAERKGT
ncbi:MAG: hypothetical protein ABIN99_05545 [Nitrosospira sp.]